MHQETLPRAFLQNFLGEAPEWFKFAILAFLALNPLLFAASPYLAGWMLLAQFIFVLAMSLRCYPLQPGGLLAIEAVAIEIANAMRLILTGSAAINCSAS